MLSRIPRRQLATPAYAFDAAAANPGKKFPKKAPAKQLGLSSSSSGVRLATVEDSYSPISSLALVVQAGPRFQQSQQELGVAQWLKSQGFKTTNSRSTIRITREADILGHSLTAALSREQLILNIDFQRSDLADSVELLSDILDGLVRRDNSSWGVYTREFVRKSNEWKQSVEQVQYETAVALAQNPLASVMDRLHQVAFRSGLANPLYPVVGDIDVDAALGFVERRFTAGNVSLVGYGVHHQDLSAAADEFLSAITLPADSSATATGTSKYFGGESHSMETAGMCGVHYAVAFPGASLTHQDYFTSLVLRQLLGSNNSSAVKYGCSLSTSLSAIQGARAESFSVSYTDAGLFGMAFSGPSADVVRQAVKNGVVALKDVAQGKFASGSAVQAAVESAKFALASEYETASRLNKIQNLANQVAVSKKLHSTSDLLSQLSQVDAGKVSSFAAKILKSKPSVASAGDAFGLHYDELGL